MGKQYLNIYFTIFFSFLFFINTGCGPAGPLQPVESVDNIENDVLKTAVYGLYQRKPEKVLTSLETISGLGNSGRSAIPYLVTMLVDKRLAKKKNYGFVKTVPVFKQTAVTLGELGEEGIFALVDALKSTSDHSGKDDDFIREAVAEGLMRGREKWGDTAFKKMKGSLRVNYILNAVTSCLELSDDPGRFNSSDPRDSLKYYKHFLPLSARENLNIYVDILGSIGDERALPVLSQIVSIQAGQSTQGTVSALSQVQRTSAFSQYYIHPLPLSEINPRIAKTLFIGFVAQGKAAVVLKLLKEGMNPDVRTITNEPAVSLAFHKKHIDIYHLLVEYGADLNLRLSRNNTLLILAAEKGDYLFTELLIKTGADVSLRNNEGFTALDVSIASLLDFWDERSTKGEAEPYLKIISLLRKSGAPDVNQSLMKSIDKKALKILSL